MILRGTEVNYFTQIRLILEAKFGDDPLLALVHVRENSDQIKCSLWIVLLSNCHIHL